VAGECESCGSLLPLPDTDGYSTCMSCGRNHKTKPDQPETPKQGAPITLTIDPASAAAAAEAAAAAAEAMGNAVKVLTPSPTTRKVGGIGCLLTSLLLVGAVIGVVVVFTRSVSDQVQSSIEGAFQPSSNLSITSGSMLLLSDPDSAGKVVDGGGPPPEIAAMIYDGGQDKRFVARLEMIEGDDTPDPIWSSDPLPSSVYAVEMVQMGGTLFVGAADELLALDVATGAQKWKAELSDKLSAGCPNCFVKIGDSLVVVTDDDQVQAFGAGSSTPLWTRQLDSPSGEVLPSDAGVVVIDQDPAKPGDAVVSVLDPASGAARSSLAPSCPAANGGFPSTMNLADTVVAVPGTPDLVASVSFGTTCLIRWDGSTGQPRWTSFLDDGIRVERATTLVTADRFFAPTGDGSIDVVDLATGSSAAVALPADTTGRPVAVVGGRLIAETVTTRGTPRGGLAAWDLATGQPVWETAMPDGSKPFSNAVPGASTDAVFEGSPLSATLVTGETVRVMTLSGDDYTASLHTLDPATGTLGDRQSWVVAEGPGTPSGGVVQVDAAGVLVDFDSAALFLPFASHQPALGWPTSGP